MRLVIISSLGAAHCHVVAETVRRHSVLAVLRPVSSGAAAAPSATRWARFRAAPLAFVAARVERRARDARMDRLEDQLCERLFQGAPPALAFDPVPAAELSGPAMVARLRALSPDLLILCGAPIVRPPLLAVPRLGTVNLHYGVAPRYRGEDTLFWPLVHHDWDHLGLTLHFVDAGVDTGRIIAHGFPARRGGESEADLWAATARLGAQVINRFLGNGAALTTRGRPQEPGGRQYLRRDRTVIRDARQRLDGWRGHLPPPATERVVFY